MKNRQKKQELITTKKVYCSPKLIEFGSINQLTQSHANGPSSDSGNNAMGS